MTDRPLAADAPPTTPRAPFIVGAPRSGTTLLRLMLDAHSQIAIPPETGFIPDVVAAFGGADAAPERFWRALIGSDTWPDFHLQTEALWRALLDAGPFDVAQGLRTFYRLYASRFGKRRWGDKTPIYAFHMAAIRAVLPESFFIHIIRDGRDVALSMNGLWFSPGEAVEDRARAWKNWVEAARAQAHLGGYLEVRYEDLVGDPRGVLTDICDGLGLRFEMGMTEYHRRALERLQEHEGRYHPDGAVRLSKAQRLAQQQRTHLPLDGSRVGRWQREMPEEEIQRFESVAGDTLRLLSYPTLG